MAEKTIEQLEVAAQAVLAPPNVVSAEQRHEAENVFLSFRKSKLPYGICKEILEKSHNDYVLFQVAVTIKECVVREWTLLQQSDIESLRNFLLHYVTQNIHLQNYVREQVLQAVAVIFKRGTVDTPGANRDSLFADVTQLISSGDLSMQLVACSILMALLNEYSTTGRSSSVGLTWEFHIRCKQTFEGQDLKRVFSFCLQVLHELEKVPTPLTREVAVVFNRFLAITEQVLNWEFLPKHLPRKVIGSFSSTQSVSFKPPPSWRDVLLDKSLTDMIFRIHRKVRYNSEMAHHSLQCLSQLASLNGGIFPDEKGKVTYLSNFVHAFLDFVACTQLQDYEALGIANVVNSLMLFFSPSVFVALPNELLHGWIQNITHLTCNFAQAAANEEMMHRDETLYMEAYEKILEAWMSFLTDISDLPENLLTEHCKNIVNSYIQCHISAPDGTRNKDSMTGGNEEEYDDVEEDDRDRFRDQLCSIGMFGRQVPGHTIPLLTRLLEERVSRLHGQLSRVQQHNTPASPGGVAGESFQSQDFTLLNCINEDIHWLLLITGYLLTEDAEGETPMIPSPIMDYAISQTSKVDVDTTLKVLASPGNEAHSIPGSESSTDQVVRLISAIFRLCEVERRAVDAKLSPYLSPQVGSSAVWLLRRWVLAYLLPDENFYSQVSLALLAAFGRDSDGGQWTVTFLLDKIISNLTAWSAEEDLISDTLQLLVALVENKERCTYVVRSNAFWKLAKDMSTNEPPFDVLSPAAKRHLYKGFVMAGSANFEGGTKDSYWQLQMNSRRLDSGQVHMSLSATSSTPTNSSQNLHPQCIEILRTLHDRFTVITSRPDLRKVAGELSIKSELMSLLEAMCGVAEATRVDTVTIVYGFLYNLLVNCVPLLDIYHNYDEMVELILEVFNTIANRQICYLGSADTQKFFETTLAMAQTYAKHNMGRRAISQFAEEEKSNNLLILMDLLTNLLSKDFIDFNVTGPEENGETKASGAEVVMYGLNITIPLMDPEVLKFPSLCTAYFRLLAYIGEIHADKILNLPEDIWKSMMASVEMGLTVFGTDITKLCLELLTCLGTHQLHVIPPSHLLQTTLSHFLKVVLQMLLFETFDMDLLDTASTALFSLICCNQEQYRQLVTEVLQQQTDQANYQRLLAAFNELTPPSVQLTFNRPGRIKFMERFDKFIINVRGFLCVR